MAEVAATTPSPSKAAPKKAKAAGKVKKEKAPANHPKYIEMAVTAINALKERQGSSRQAIHKYITTNFSVGQDNKVVGTHLKLALKRGADTGVLKHVKGTGASGSFKVNPEAKKKKEKKPKAAKKAKVSKPKKVKPESPAKAAKSPTKAKSPKKAVKPVKSIAKATKSPKKAVAKKPASPAKPPAAAKKAKVPAKAKKVAAKK